MTRDSQLHQAGTGELDRKPNVTSGHFGVSVKSGVRLAIDTKRSDEDIALAAIERLSWSVSVPKYSIHVQVENGWVTLTGQVDWWFQKEEAEQDVRPMRGVVGLTNETTIKPTVDTATLIDDIAHALHRSWFFIPSNVQLRADRGRVVLNGSAPSAHERQRTAPTACAAPGAFAVENDIAGH